MPALHEIFFSYAWGDALETGDSREKIVDQLYQSLLADGYRVTRDKYDLGYRGFISDFMTRIGKGQHIVVAISRKYLRSPYCMFELYEIARQSNFDKYTFSEKVLPIMIEFVDFSKPAVLEEYMAYWEVQFKEWDALVQTRSGSLSAEQFQRYDKIKMVWQNFGKLADWLVDMNTLNPVLLTANNFAAVKKSIQQDQQVKEQASQSLPETGLTPVISNTGKNRFPVKIGIVIALAVVTAILFFYGSRKKVVTTPTAQSLSVFVHGKMGKQDMILRKQGYVLMDVKGGERKKADINENGVAYFQNLFLGDSVRLEVDFSEPYKSTVPDSVFIVNKDGRIYLPVELKGIDKVKGIVLFNDAPLEGVIVSIDNRSDTTDANGRYQLTIPEAEQKKQYNVWFNKKGFKSKPAPAYPQTGEDLNIVMEK